MTTKRVTRKAGGFRVPTRTARLVFSDEFYAGAEIVVNLGIPLGVSMAMRRLTDDDDPAYVYRVFLEHGLISWNLEDEAGLPMAMTLEALEALPTDFVLTLLDNWTNQIGKVPVPLWARSGDGSTLAVESARTDSS